MPGIRLRAESCRRSGGGATAAEPPDLGGGDQAAVSLVPEGLELAVAVPAAPGVRLTPIAFAASPRVRCRCSSSRERYCQALSTWDRAANRRRDAAECTPAGDAQPDDCAYPIYQSGEAALPFDSLGPRTGVGLDTAYEVLRADLLLDGHAQLNITTFVTTWMRRPPAG